MISSLWLPPTGWQLAPVPWCAEGFWIEREDDDALPLGSTAEHLSGLFYIQEASSMLPVAALFADNRQPERVMDVAAAPGSKTTQIAARMGNAGGILANEFSASRVKVLHANISRCGISNVALTHFDGRVFGAALPETFDAILLDAPCSGEGVVRKDADALKKLVAGEQPRHRRHSARAYRQRLPCSAPWRDAGVFHLHPES
ncbi:ribosomal RNA small subunit methyltransferase F [Klebsiella pneumoniae subsp. ozaenae]|uniref:Ribosomal RNA small subunit methyltransferase F n=1 Tax=Klebsiella pneumoniae subsp. ozaenae TaxID=574 RepID=A0A378BG88_KLEPO|nr:ribosomal RNA small subunit methyltransferase F [Klebsiella pneumoniae subsp. ozaenae]